MVRIQNLFVFAISTALALAASASLGQSSARAQVDQPCIVNIIKSASPANDTAFNFSETGDETNSFSLRDPSDPHQIFGMNIDQTVTVTEENRPGWTLDGIDCTEGVTNCGSTSCLTATVDGNSVTFQCIDNDTATCTFTNSFTGSTIPTLSEWGLISLAVMLGIAGIFIMRRKRAAA